MNIIHQVPCGDYLEIEEIDPCCFRLLKHCGNLSALNVHGRGKKIRVSFVSDSRETAQGFVLMWTEIGGSTILTYETHIYGQITSPGYPGNYPNNANYTWIIKTGHQKADVTVNIAVMSINKWKGSPCDDYLLIKEIDPCCFTAFKRCGDGEGMTVYVRGMEIQVSFISDNDGLTAKGFDLTWTVTLPATTTLPKTTFITAQKVDLTSSTPITTTTRRNVRTTKLLYISSTNPIRSTAPRENLKSTTLLHMLSTTHIKTTARRENLKPTTLLHTSTSTKPIRTTPQKENLKSTTLLHKSTSTKPSSTTQRRENLKSTTLLHTSTFTKPIRTTPQKENLKSTTPVYESKQSQTSIDDLYGVPTLPHKAQSVTTMTETTATNEPEDTLLGMTSPEIVYLIGGVGAFVLVVSIIVICVAGRGQKDNKKIQKRHQKDTDKRETLASMHVYSSPMYETIPADMISPDEATGDYALVNDKEFTWYAAKNVSESEHMTRVDSFSNVTDVYHTLEPNTRFTEPSPLLQRISNVYHTLEMTSFLQPEYDLDQNGT
ncbi:uncharacterized protein LOC111123356 isoform X2 [Crassostrea virginica]